MKLNNEFIVNEIADKKVAVAVGENKGDFNGFIKMNDDTAYIFSLLSEEISYEDLLKKVNDKFPEEADEKTKENLDNFLSALKGKGLLSE